MTDSPNFDTLLRQAVAEGSCRLLLVFACAELPDDATPAQRSAFAEGKGGALAPIMCVDKTPGELTGFAALAEEARTAGPPWQVVFVATLDNAGAPPSKPDIDSALERMVDAVRLGAAGRFAAFGPDGEQIVLT